MISYTDYHNDFPLEAGVLLTLLYNLYGHGLRFIN